MQVFLTTPYENGVCAAIDVGRFVITVKSAPVRRCYLTLEYAYPITGYVKTAFRLILASGELPLS